MKRKIQTEHFFDQPSNVDTTIATVISKHFSRSGNHYTLNYLIDGGQFSSRFDAGADVLALGSVIPIRILKNEPSEIRLLRYESLKKSELNVEIDTLVTIDPRTMVKTVWLDVKHSDRRISKIDTIVKGRIVVFINRFDIDGGLISKRMFVSATPLK